MSKTRILIGLAASLGFGVAVACGSSSSNNNDESDSGSASSSSGGASSGGTPTSSGGTVCASGQTMCIAILGGTTCIDAGDMCIGTNIFANECSTTSTCSAGQVCCSSYVGSDGGIITYPQADAAGPDGATAAAPGLPAGVAVQCLSQCPANSYSSQVCVLEADGGSPSSCPEGTACQQYGLGGGSSAVPTTLCLPVYAGDGGGYTAPVHEAGAGDAATGTNDAATTTGADAAAE